MAMYPVGVLSRLCQQRFPAGTAQPITTLRMSEALGCESHSGANGMRQACVDRQWDAQSAKLHQGVDTLTDALMK